MPINRRDFLKVVGVGAGVAALTQVPGMWEKISFSPDKLVGGGLLNSNDIQNIRKRMNDFGDTVGFGEDKEAWQKSVEDSCTVLSHLNGLRAECQETKDKEMGRLVDRDYRELSSMLWLVLKVGEKYRYDPVKLKEILDLPTGPEKIIADVMPTVGSYWLFETISGIHSNVDTESNVNYLMKDPTFLGWFSNNFLSWNMSDEVIEENKKEIGKTLGAIETIISSKDLDQEQLKNLGSYLQSLRLSRVAKRIDVYKDSSLGGSTSNGYTDLVLSEKDTENLRNGSGEWKAFLIHELAHTVWDLVRLVEDPKERWLIRGKIEEMLGDLWPTRDLRTFLNPQGRFRSIDKDGDGYEDNVINEAAVTAYSSGYFLSDLDYAGEKLINSCLKNPKITKILKDDELKDIGEITALEQKILERAREIVPLLEQSERNVSRVSLAGTEDVESDRWLKDACIPLAIQDLLQTDRSAFMELVACSDPNYDSKVVGIIIDGYFVDIEYGFETSAGEELFADIFQCSYRKDEPEVVNEMSDGRLDKWRQNVDLIMDLLIKNNLAVKMPLVA